MLAYCALRYKITPLGAEKYTCELHIKKKEKKEPE